MSKVSRAEYYERVFERLEKDHKHTWNWSAFFFFGLWMLYRKMYMYAFVYIAFVFAVSILSVNLLERDDNLFYFLCYSYAIFERIGLGYFGNYLYYRTVKYRISKGYHLLDKYSPTAVEAVFVIFSPIIWLADYISRKLQLKSYINQDVNTNAKNIQNYLNPNRKNHWIVKTANALIIVIFSCLTLILVLSLATRQERERIITEEQILLEKFK